MSLGHFWPFFWSPKWGPSKRSARLCTDRSRCRYKEEKRGRDKKRDRDTERARGGPKRHANYGPSLPVSIPTLGKSLAQIYIAQIAQIKGIYYWGFKRRLERCAAVQGGHIECKVGPESGAHLLLYAPLTFCAPCAASAIRTGCSDSFGRRCTIRLVSKRQESMQSKSAKLFKLVRKLVQSLHSVGSFTVFGQGP